MGQAINYANIGSIFESRRQTDLAWVYYRKSMAMNEEAGNTLGISLCHTYFGSLHEKAGEYADAAEEYEAAYSLMRGVQRQLACPELADLACRTECDREHGQGRELS